jgi:5-methylcytosine-specific restriction protein A
MGKLPWIASTKQTWSNNKFYHTSEWRKLRAQYIRLNPLCAECERNDKLTDCTGKGAGVVDHIQPIRLGGEALDINNLQTLCTSCHNIKSAKEKNK